MNMAKLIFSTITGTLLGGFAAYIIQFKLNFLGANFITFSDVFQAWAATMSVGAFSGCLLGLLWITK